MRRQIRYNILFFVVLFYFFICSRVFITYYYYHDVFKSSDRNLLLIASVLFVGCLTILSKGICRDNLPEDDEDI